MDLKFIGQYKSHPCINLWYNKGVKKEMLYV
jgi:hypothetical protein